MHQLETPEPASSPTARSTRSSGIPPPSSETSPRDAGCRPVASGDGWCWGCACWTVSTPGRRRSLSALRATQSRNRYRTARKRISARRRRARARGAYSSSKVTVEVPSSSRSPALSCTAPSTRRPLDLHAVGRAEVLDDPCAAGGAGSPRGGARRWRRRAPRRTRGCADGRPAGSDDHALAVVEQQRARAPGRGRFVDRRAHALGGRVDHRVAAVPCSGSRDGPASRTRRAWIPNSPRRRRSSVWKRRRSAG